MRNIRLTLQYDGGRYAGWQRLGGKQAGRTIQGILEEALFSMTGEEVALIASGRTDAGVHALGQVANFHTRSKMKTQAILAWCERELPRDMAVIEVQDVDARFHARFHARSKRYAYRLDVGSVHDVFMRRYALHVPQKLEWLPIRDAADRLCGAHDFTSFTNARLKEKSAVRELQSLEFEWDGQCVDLVFSGTGFLHNMVRIMAGTLLEIGAGRMLPTDIPQMIAARDRKTAGPMLPAHALVLLDVQYD